MNKLKILLNDYCQIVIPYLFQNSSYLSAKNKSGIPFQNEVSFPTHIINSVFCSSVIYSQEHPNVFDEKPPITFKILISTMTLHDIGKYMENKYNLLGGNTKVNLHQYLEQDDFHIKEYFPEIDLYFDEILWLIQNTELKDISQSESYGFRSKFGRLSDYLRLGDKVASLTKDELYYSKIYDLLRNHNVHILQIPKFPQTILRRELLKNLKHYFEDNNTIPFMLFEDGFYYLCPSDFIFNLEEFKSFFIESINSKLQPEEDNSQSNLPFKLNNQSLDDSSILNSTISSERKKEILISKIIDKIGKGIMKNFSIILPIDNEVLNHRAIIAYCVYKMPNFDAILSKEALSPLKKRIQTLKNDENIGSTRYKAYLTRDIFENYENYAFEEIYDQCNDFFEQQCNINGNFDFLDSILNNIIVDFHLTELILPEIPTNKLELCFLCGTKAKNDYTAPNKHFMQARGFSKRGRIKDLQKKICRLCDLEKTLLENMVKDKGYNISSNFMFAIFYFDKVFANVSYFSEEISNVPLQADASIIETQRFRLNDFDCLYHILPFTYFGKEDSAKQSSRVKITNQIFSYIKNYGCKSIITSTFTIFKPSRELFYNENPSQLEYSLQVSKISTFQELDMKKAFLDIIFSLDFKKGCYEVKQFDLLFFVSFIKNKADQRYWVKDEYIECIKKCFSGNFMKIQELAQKGKILYGLYGNLYAKSSYERTKFMRYALDYLLMGLQQNLVEDQLELFVAGGLWKLMMREEFSKKKDADSLVLDFVKSLELYLKENNWISVPSLSSIEQYLIDTYEFSLLTLPKEA